MHSLIGGIRVAGLILPDEVYILSSEKERGYPIESIDYIFTIRREEQILVGLDLIFRGIAHDYELVAYRGSKRISADCYEFKLRCRETEDGELLEMPMYLHRLRKFEEEVERESQYEAQ